VYDFNGFVRRDPLRIDQSSLTEDSCFYSICPETKSAKSGELVVLACINMIYNNNFTGICSRLLRSWRAQPDPFSFKGPITPWSTATAGLQTHCILQERAELHRVGCHLTGLVSWPAVFTGKAAAFAKG
jgi:hypothetical protein